MTGDTHARTHACTNTHTYVDTEIHTDTHTHRKLPYQNRLGQLHISLLESSLNLRPGRTDTTVTTTT